MTTKFKFVELFKEQVLGIGSYGKVCQARCDGNLICAAKLLLETLFHPSAHQDQVDSARLKPVRRFEQECEFMRTIQHPNIVQFLGFHDDPSTGLQVILMELMDQNLTSFLKKASGPIPYYLQVNFCHDISLALSYLHSNEITHRDLSSNNILLIGNVRAKVSDFGMAKLIKLNPSASRSILTRGVGTEAYMPPECRRKNPDYTEKVDCFSFGVLTIQILTRRPPEPGDIYEEVEIVNNEKVPTGIAHVTRREVERRKNHIDEIDSKHPLRNLALKCLEDESKNRPSAQEFCKCLGELKELQEYTESKEGACDGVVQSRSHSSGGATCDVGVNTEKDERLVELEAKLESQREQLARQDEEMKKSKETVDKKEERLKEMVKLIKKKDEMIVELKLTNNLQQETIKQSRQEVETVRCVVGEKDQFMAERERKVTGIQQQLNACTAEKEGLEKQIRELHQTLEHKDIVNLHLCSRKDGKKTPRTMYRSNDAVVNGSTVYLRPAQLQDIYRYNQASGWSKFAVCLFKSSPLAIIRGFLTTVGGGLNNNCVNQLCSLTENESRNRRTWTEVFPPMPTKRSNTSTLCTGSHLIVAGGKGERKEVLTTIEVLNIETRLWSVAANLWEPCWCSSMTVLDGHLYVVGGINSSGQQTDTAYVCSLESLLQSLCPPLESETARSGSTSPLDGLYQISPTRQNGSLSAAAAQNGTSTRRHNTVDWNRIRDLPVTQSTCVLFQGRLLAISGKTSNAELPTRDIYVYSPVMDSWEVVGHVTIGRFACFAAVLPDNQLMIAGGYTDSQNAHDSVEFAINV